MEKAKNIINDKKYYLLDAGKLPLGRIATKAAVLLRGKNSAGYKPNVVSGNIVIVINANKIHLSGTKESSKQYFHYSGYHGGIKTINFSTLKVKKPEGLIFKAVKGMLPKNRLQVIFLKNLKIYADDQHPYKNVEEI